VNFLELSLWRAGLSWNWNVHATPLDVGVVGERCQKLLSNDA
jgi:hypothetical protein